MSHLMLLVVGMRQVSRSMDTTDAWHAQAGLHMLGLIAGGCCWDGAGAQPLVKLGWGVVDVRDAAKAHVAAIENLNAKGR